MANRFRITNRRLIELTSLAFAVNIIAPLILLSLNYYPYPAFFADETDTHKDFYHVCHFTLNKVSSYGAWKNIYPPFGHFYCIVMRPFFSQMYNSAHTAQFNFADAATFYLLALVATASLLFLGITYIRRFGYSRGYFLSFCCMATSPQLIALDRGNHMLFAQIFTNMFFAALVCKQSNITRFIVCISSGVAAGMKPYMLFPLLLSPATAFAGGLSAIGWNIISYIMWQPPGIELWIRNIKEFTDASGLFPSHGMLTADLLAWTSFRYQVSMLLKAMSTNPEIIPANAFTLTLLALSVIVYALFICIVVNMIIKTVVLALRMKGLRAWLTQLPFAGRFIKASPGKAPNSISLFLPFCATYTLLFAIMPLLTKSIYWYSLIFLLPTVLLADLLLYNHSSLFSMAFCWLYQATKILTLTTLVYPDFHRDCWNSTYPPAANFLTDRVREWSGLPFLMPTENLVPHCPVSNGLVIASLMIRTIALPLMACFAAEVFLRIYTQFCCRSSKTRQSI